MLACGNTFGFFLVLVAYLYYNIQKVLSDLGKSIKSLQQQVDSLKKASEATKSVQWFHGEEGEAFNFQVIENSSLRPGLYWKCYQLVFYIGGLNRRRVQTMKTFPSFRRSKSQSFGL